MLKPQVYNRTRYEYQQFTELRIELYFLNYRTNIGEKVGCAVYGRKRRRFHRRIANEKENFYIFFLFSLKKKISHHDIDRTRFVLKRVSKNSPFLYENFVRKYYKVVR